LEADLEIAKIKAFLKKYKRPVTCVRILVTYWIFLFIATHTTVFDYGVTKGKLNFIISLMVMLYKLLSISFVPGILTLWLFENLKKKSL
jgi:hypothetical protein